MRQSLTLKHEFVEFIPEKLENQTLYISVTYATASHRCCCGCGREVVTPFSPTDWSITFDGETVSLTPSIGNWGFPCRSHYWIRGSTVQWAGSWSAEQVQSGRLYDTKRKATHFKERNEDRPAKPSEKAVPIVADVRKKGLLGWLSGFWS